MQIPEDFFGNDSVFLGNSIFGRVSGTGEQATQFCDHQPTGMTNERDGYPCDRQSNQKTGHFADYSV